MSNSSPVSPPFELRQKWISEWVADEKTTLSEYLAEQAAQWGWAQRDALVAAELDKARDQELDACCEWIVSSHWIGSDWEDQAVDALRAARRPKPLSLKDEGLAVIDKIGRHLSIKEEATLRQIVEQLP